MNQSTGHRNSIGISKINRNSKQRKITKKRTQISPKVEVGPAQIPDEETIKAMRKAFSRLFDII